jgi:putative endonuclease
MNTSATMDNQTIRLGKLGEDIAITFLGRKGYSILERNFRCTHGEIDIIARAPEGEGSSTIVFVEVKTRSSTRMALPEHSISPKKIQHLLDSTQYYIMLSKQEIGQWRIDVIAILLGQHPGEEQITHFENAVTGETCH